MWLALERGMNANLEARTVNTRRLDMQLRARGIADRWVLAAMIAVPRERFVPAALADDAYTDRALPIACGQSMKNPHLLAMMLESLRVETSDRVLEIGTGTGYSAAVLSVIAGEVFTIERLPLLASAARERLAALHYDRVTVGCSDGSLGWAEHAPFQGILVTATGPRIPISLREQLAIGGRLVMSVLRDGIATLAQVTRVDHDHYETTFSCAVELVPLIGEEGWPDDSDIMCTD
ncbi:MAG: protein-L-isoaspartate(D-aspartate) O-methyltransferase [Kofleriaceae bacterium]